MKQLLSSAPRWRCRLPRSPIRTRKRRHGRERADGGAARRWPQQREARRRGREEAGRRGEEQLHEEVRQRRRAPRVTPRPRRRSSPARPRRASPRSASLTATGRQAKAASPSGGCGAGRPLRRRHQLAPWNPRRCPRAACRPVRRVRHAVRRLQHRRRRRAPLPRRRRAPGDPLARQADRVHAADVDERPAAQLSRLHARAGLRFAARRFGLAARRRRRAAS